MKLFNFNAKGRKIVELEKNIKSLILENEHLRKANKVMADLINNKPCSINNKTGV